MVRAGGFISDKPASAADSLQAAYFRGLLADERVLVAARLHKERAALEALRAADDDSLLLRRAERGVRATESEHRDLDRLIDDLDRRFAAWRFEGSES